MTEVVPSSTRLIIWTLGGDVVGASVQALAVGPAVFGPPHATSVVANSSAAAAGAAAARPRWALWLWVDVVFNDFTGDSVDDDGLL